MNKIYKYVFMAVIAMGTASCGNDWLDLEPSTSIRSEVKSLSDVGGTLNGIYSTMQNAYAYSGRLVYYGDVCGDDMQATSSTKRTANYYMFGFTKSNAPSTHWSYLYNIIQNCNVILASIDNISTTGDDESEQLADYKGQALALRGMALFDLTKFYGYPYTMDNGASLGACIVTDVVDKGYMPQRSTVAECYTQVIKDLEAASQLIGDDFNKGKFNKWSLLTLLSRVYLYHGDNQKALDTAVKAIEGAENEGYKLWSNADYATAWGNDASTTNKGEVLLEIINLTTDSPGKESLGYLHSPSGYKDLAVTASFYNLLAKDKNDVRLSLINISSGWGYVNKYQPQEGETVADANIPLIRLSETYLNAAEAAVKMGKNDDAVKYLNPIVQRANPANSVEGETLTLDRVLTERRKELVGEGQRFFDLLRNGLKVQRLDEKASKLKKTSHFAEYMEFGTEFYKVVLPIPKSEINVSHLEQNKGYGD